MEAPWSSPQFTVEKSRRALSPGTASARSPSSSSYPNAQGSSVTTTTTTTTGGSRARSNDKDVDLRGSGEGHRTREAASGGRRRTSPQHSGRAAASARPIQDQPHGQHTEGGGRAAMTSSLFDTTVLTSSASTPSGEAGRAMAHLLDSVASSSSPASSHTPPRAHAWRSPGKTGTPAADPEEQRHGQRPAQKRAGEKETLSARRRRRAVDAEESESTDLLTGSPAWSQTAPHPQLRPQQQQHQQQRSFPQSQPTRTGGSGRLHHSPLVSSASYPQHQQRQSASSPIKDETETGTPTSTNAEETSSVFEASFAYSRDDQRSPGPNLSNTSAPGSNWASPAEVLQLRAMVQEITARYQREQTRLQSELTKAQAECSAYAGEQERVRQLHKAYTEGLAQCEQAKRREAQWVEERALQQLQLEKMMVENQRLQLFIAKKQRLHKSAQGSNTVFVPSESQERIMAAVQGVTTAAAAAANTASSSSDRLGGSSRSPFPYPYGPAMLATSATAEPAARPSTAPPFASAQPRSAVPRETGNAASLSPTHRGGGATAATSGALPAQTRRIDGLAGASEVAPFTFLFSGSTSPPPPPQQQQQQQQRQRTGTVGSGSVMGADHTQLPTAAITGGGSTEMSAAAVSPSTNASTSYLSLSPSPLHQPPHPEATSMSGGRGGGIHSTRTRTATANTTTVTSAAGAVAAASAVGEAESSGDAQRQHRSSSLVTPSPTISAAATTPSSVSLEAASTVSAHQRTRYFGNGGGMNGKERSHPFLSDSGRSATEDAGVADEPDHDNDDPSYARGVNDVSSSSNSRGSNVSGGVAAAFAMGRLLDAQQQQQQQQQEETSSSPLVTSGSLGGGRLASTTATGDTAREVTEAAAATGTTARTSIATTTTTTAPSLLASTTATLPNGLPSFSSTTWSLQYLYQLPRTPAEALQEEVRMMKEIHRLTEENATLAARWEHALTLKNTDADQRERQLLRLAQEHEQARKSAAHWELAARQLQSEVAAMEARRDESRDELERAMAASREEHLRAQARLVQAEATSRAALTATREETMGKLQALRRTFHEFVQDQHQQQQLAMRLLSEGGARGGGAEEGERLQGVVEALRTELHESRAAAVALEDRHHAMQSQWTTHVTKLENTLVRTRDALERANSERRSAVLRVDELEAEVERLQETAVAREACLHATDESLRVAAAELTTQHAQLEEASTWQARAEAMEEELSAQRVFYEKEINVYKTAACGLQERHHAEMKKTVQRYEKLVVRFEAMKLRLSAVLPSGAGYGGGVDDHEWTTSRPKKRSRRSAANTADNSPNTAATKEQVGQAAEDFIVPARDAEARKTARLACDSVKALRTSVEATDRVAKSINRSAAS